MYLFKTEPTAYSLAQLEKDGSTVWDGVKNPLALKHLRAVKKGEEIFIYHTGDEKSIIGIARAVEDAKEESVKITFQSQLKQPVTLAQIKANPVFKDFALVRMSRLSVMPVPLELWRAILKIAKES